MTDISLRRRFIVGVDDSAGSVDALRWAHGEAVLRCAELVAVHAVPAKALLTAASATY